MTNVDYDKSVEFKNLKTYKINIKPVRVATDTRIDTPFMQQRVVNELKTALPLSLSMILTTLLSCISGCFSTMPELISWFTRRVI